MVLHPFVFLSNAIPCPFVKAVMGRAEVFFVRQLFVQYFTETSRLPAPGTGTGHTRTMSRGQLAHFPPKTKHN